MTPERLSWLLSIANSGRKTVGVAFFQEALSTAGYRLGDFNRESRELEEKQ